MKVFYLPVFVFFFVFGIACQKNDKATVVLQDTSIEKYPQTEKHTSNTNLAVTVTDNDVHIRNQPHLDGEILGTLTSGTVGTVLAESHLRMIHGETHPWYKVKTADGITGWIYGKYLSGDCVSVINQEYYQFPSVSNRNSGMLAYKLMEFQYSEDDGSVVGITLDTSMMQLEKNLGTPELRSGTQGDTKDSWNPYAGFSRCVWNGMEVAFIPHKIKVFSEDGFDYIEKEDDPIVRIIDVTGDKFKTSLGIGSGTPKASVIDVYGIPCAEQKNSLSYFSGSVMGTVYLDFIFDSDECVERMSLYWGD